jgi:hypothetical protein
MCRGNFDFAAVSAHVTANNCEIQKIDIRGIANDPACASSPAARLLAEYFLRIVAQCSWMTSRIGL